METGLVFARMAGLVALGIVSLLVGFRMLWLTWRTRQFPEAAIGIHILVLMLGYAAEFVGIAAASELGPLAVLLRGAGNLCYAVSNLVYLLFTWRVFRPASAVARAVAISCGAALIVGWSGEVFTSAFDFRPARFAAPWFWIAYAPRLVCMAWAAWEAFRAYGLARRRLRLGMSDPIVANRFYLWGMAATSEFLIYAVVGIAIAVGRPAAFLTGGLALAVSALGLAAAVTILLAFLPPRFYRRWILRSA